MMNEPNLLFQDIDTVMIDMDGTVLDLAFDNYFWQELVPATFAELHDLSPDHAREVINQQYKSVTGKLSWYCVDYWTERLGIGVEDLKWRHRHLIAYLPGAVEFLKLAKGFGKNIWLVTNAHPKTLAIKCHQTHVDKLVDRAVSSHDFGTPKETVAFWQMLEERTGFVSAHTLLIDDNVAVLAAARAAGIAHTLAVRRPDSRLPPRRLDGIAGVDGVIDLLGFSVS